MTGESVLKPSMCKAGTRISGPDAFLTNPIHVQDPIEKKFST